MKLSRIRMPVVALLAFLLMTQGVFGLPVAAMATSPVGGCKACCIPGKGACATMPCCAAGSKSSDRTPAMPASSRAADSLAAFVLAFQLAMELQLPAAKVIQSPTDSPLHLSTVPIFQRNCSYLL